MLYDHFRESLGTGEMRTISLNREALGIQRHNLQHLDENFTEEEITEVVFKSPAEKAPGRDDFIGKFYKECWEIVKKDLTAALQQLFELRAWRWNLLNSGFITLVLKKDGAAKVTDYWPISLMHNVAKILGELMANRLASCINSMVSRAQSAFIKKRSIQDNFLYVQNMIRKFHSAKEPMLFLKLDIAKAFDNVRWAYILELMEHMGFGQRWRDIFWILSVLIGVSD